MVCGSVRLPTWDRFPYDTGSEGHQMKAIAIFNNKGGVGKTTFLCNLAGYLALRKEQKVLIVDADPQCNATQSVFADPVLEKLYTSGSFTVMDVVKPLAAGKGFTKSLHFEHSDAFGLDVLAGDPDMSLMEDLLANDWVNGTSGDLRGLRTTFLFNNLLSRCEEYDFVFFDMGPSLGSINRAVLIAADYFITPMSIDIFSLRAIANIGKSLRNWKKRLQRGLADVEDLDELEVPNAGWKLSFLGYVNQQYVRKTIRGRQQAVKAYDRIIKQIPGVVERELIDDGDSPTTSELHLGSIPSLHSLVPLSQTNHVPIFELKGRHGVVGAHFAKVKEYERTIGQIAERFLVKAGA